LMTVMECAKLVGIADHRIRYLMKKDDVPTYRRGAQVYVSAFDAHKLKEIYDSQKDKP